MWKDTHRNSSVHKGRLDHSHLLIVVHDYKSVSKQCVSCCGVLVVRMSETPRCGEKHFVHSHMVGTYLSSGVKKHTRQILTFYGCDLVSG